MINWTHVFTTYIPYLTIIGIGVLIALIFNQVLADLVNHMEANGNNNPNIFSPSTIMAVLASIQALIAQQIHSILNLRKENLFSPEVEVTFLALIIMGIIVKMDNPTYLLSFATFKAPKEWKVSHEQIIEMMKCQDCFTQESLDFMKRLLVRSGTGQSTAWPPGIVQCLRGEPTDNSIQGSRTEAETIIFNIVENAMKKANVTADEIDVLVINCSLFSPTPSLCAAVITKFQMRSDILSYNLSGMGCGASLLALDLAKNMLHRRRFGGKALVVSTEIITPNLYKGNERAFLLQNTLFRCGGSAMVLSNKWLDGSKAWFKLLHCVRVQNNTKDGYECVFECEDSAGERGVRLSKEIVKVAGKTMEKNLTTLGPLVLPWSEQAKVAYSIVAKVVMKKFFGKRVNVYVPDFKRGVDHFCIHAGGRAVIDGEYTVYFGSWLVLLRPVPLLFYSPHHYYTILYPSMISFHFLLPSLLGIEKNMKLEKFHTEPSRMALLNFGNTSSSSIWYEMEYIMDEQKSNPLRKGDRIMQVAFGSGFKCTSGVWLRL
jgi:3-ketoacyl-CoA synthase